MFERHVTIDVLSRLLWPVPGGEPVTTQAFKTHGMAQCKKAVGAIELSKSRDDPAYRKLIEHNILDDVVLECKEVRKIGL